MRKKFEFESLFLEIWRKITDEKLRLRFYESIIEFGINDALPEDDELSASLLVPIQSIEKSHEISDKRSEAGKKSKKVWNKNASKKNSKKRTKEQKEETKETVQTSTEIVEVKDEKKDKNTEKREQNIELIDAIQKKVESYWLIYKSWTNEWINATNLRTSKQFKATAEKFWLTTTQLALAVIDASMSDKFRNGKINNCETIYHNYARIINNARAKNQRLSDSIATLPWA